MIGKKPLYLPWNEEEFLADVHVRGMSSKARWMYRALLQSAFFCSTRPCLPNNDNELWIMAGAESKREWLSHKDSVLVKFISMDVGGIQLLENKRLTKDWDRLVVERERMSELGARSAEVQRTLSVRATLGQRVVAQREEKLSEVEVKEKENQREPAIRITGKPKHVAEACAEIWQEEKGNGAVCPYPDIPDRKKRWEWLVQNHDRDTIIEGFKFWAKEADGSERFPLNRFMVRPAEFMQRVVGIKENERKETDETVVGQNDLVQLNARIAEIGQPFTGESYTFLSRTLVIYSADEIFEAYREFTQNFDDFKMNRATRDFSQGGGIAVLEKRRKQKRTDDILVQARAATEKRVAEDAQKARVKRESEQVNEASADSL